MAVSSVLFLWLAPLAALWALSRRFPRGSHARLWARLWCFTLRERLRSIRRAALRQRSRGYQPSGARSQLSTWARLPAAVTTPLRRNPARDGVWVGNVFRPRAFEQHRLQR